MEFNIKFRPADEEEGSTIVYKYTNNRGVRIENSNSADALRHLISIKRTDIITQMINNFQIDKISDYEYDLLIRFAIQLSLYDIIPILIQKGEESNRIINYNAILATSGSWSTNREETLNFMRSILDKVTDFYSGMLRVTLDGFYDAVILIHTAATCRGIRFDLTSYNTFINGAQQMKEKYPSKKDDYEKTLEILNRYRNEEELLVAAETGDSDQILNLLEHGVNNFDAAIKLADDAGFPDIGDLIENYRASEIFEEAQSHWAENCETTE